MKKAILILFYNFTLTITLAQVSTLLNEENFAYQVKQIDEFIERFNNEDSTLIKNYLREKNNLKQINRVDLIKSLFNYTDYIWNVEEIKQFISDATEKSNPILLDYLDDEWYAELECSGTYKGKEEKFILILKTQLNEANRASRWVIESVYADFLLLKEAINSEKTLNPAIHGTDFMGLKIAFQDFQNFSNYIAEDANTSQLLLFIHEVVEKNLVLNQVVNITYHFLQVENWIFQVRFYLRSTENSGWLICKLIKVDEKNKIDYKRENLFIL